MTYPTCLTCPRALRARVPYVPTCLTCPRALRAHVPTCLRTHVPYVPACPRAYVPTCHTCLCAPTSPDEETTDKKPHRCHFCTRLFGGLLRLSRHMKVCAPPPTPGNQGLIVIDGDSGAEYSGACARGDGDGRGHGTTNKWYEQLDSDKELFTPLGIDDDVDGEDESISSSLNSEDDVEDNTEDDAGPNRVYGKKAWKGTTVEKVNRVPHNIDGKCVYRIVTKTHELLLERCVDGRPWKKDTQTKWSGYETVRVKNCKGLPRCPPSCLPRCPPRCPRSECELRKESGKVNRLRFDKSLVSDICLATLFKK